MPRAPKRSAKGQFWKKPRVLCWTIFLLEYVSRQWRFHIKCTVWPDAETTRTWLWPSMGPTPLGPEFHWRGNCYNCNYNGNAIRVAVSQEFFPSFLSFNPSINSCSLPSVVLDGAESIVCLCEHELVFK